MTPSPTVPDDIKNVISSPQSTICGNFINTILRLPTLLYNFFNWFLNSDGTISNVAKQQVIPPGVIIPFAGAVAPADWVLAQGQAVSRPIANGGFADTYAELWALFSTTFGTGDGATTFNLPDLRARFPVGAGAFEDSGTVAVGDDGGEDVHELTPNEAGLNHTHVTGRTAANSGPGGDDFLFVVSPNDLNQGTLTGRHISTGSGFSEAQLSTFAGRYTAVSTALDPDDGAAMEMEPHNNLPPYLALNYIIKL